MSEQALQIPDLPGISVVAYYQDKPDKLSSLIQSIQDQLKQIYNDNFVAYHLDQVHGTIIGCEGLKTRAGIVNKWFYQHRNEVKYADILGLITYLQKTTILPLKIRFTGYQPQFDYQFLSRNQHPSFRAFQLQKTASNKLVPVVIGWSVNEQMITSNFQNLRHNCQQYNHLHKYHKTIKDIDNDFYLRLGTITKDLDQNKQLKSEQVIRKTLQNTEPFVVELSNRNLSLVKYQDLALSLHNTKSYPLDKINLSSEFLNDLYQ